MNLVEQVGSGIGRIQNALKAVKIPAAEFKTEGFFSVVFRRRFVIQYSDHVHDSIQVEILRFMENDSTVTIVGLSKLLNTSRRSIQYHISKLEANGALRREGARKNGKWIIVNTNDLGNS